MSTVIKSTQARTLEIWGGIECTINRINDEYRDQLDYSGHYVRAHDINKIAELGISKLRYPILWERHEQSQDQQINWTWISNQLDLIRKYEITPIAGLVHHGSGPAFTNLLDDNFAIKLASYAKKVASKFPWLEYYTPVNEPLTTARFSGLYGFWYPHHQQEFSFIKMLLNQVKATVLSMQAIRKINPAAKLVQTEDLAKVHSTKCLQYQADFENERRLLTYDLLCGKVNKHHFFWNYFIQAGIEENELQFFLDNTCPPDIIGCNYYVTSERWLDGAIEKYPCHTHGCNGKDIYADTEAVRMGKAAGLQALLSEVWHRYRLPLAVTETHLNCTREEQMRWLKQTWDDCNSLSQCGVDIKAITAWSLLGSYDWSSLLTQRHNHYEAGVFDTRSNALRPTALSKMIRCLTNKIEFDHPLLYQEGWWLRNKNDSNGCDFDAENKQERLLIIGSNTAFGSALATLCNRRSIPTIIVADNDFNYNDHSFIPFMIHQHKLWGIVDANVDTIIKGVKLNAMKSVQMNFAAENLLVNYCHKSGIPCITFLTPGCSVKKPELLDTALDLFIDGEQGIWQIKNSGFYTRCDLAEVNAKQRNPDRVDSLAKSLSEMSGRADKFTMTG